MYFDRLYAWEKERELRESTPAWQPRIPPRRGALSLAAARALRALANRLDAPAMSQHSLPEPTVPPS